jgi:hypothetical protein
MIKKQKMLCMPGEINFCFLGFETSINWMKKQIIKKIGIFNLKDFEYLKTFRIFVNPNIAKKGIT